MSNLKNRLEKLEAVLTGPRRQIVVRALADGAATKEEMDAFLFGQGIDARDGDVLLILRTIVSPGRVDRGRPANLRLLSAG